MHEGATSAASPSLAGANQCRELEGTRAHAHVQSAIDRPVLLEDTGQCEHDRCVKCRPEVSPST
jgi:hypothetical protein